MPNRDVIIGILAAALLPQIWSARDKANDTAREANVRTLVTAMTQFWMDNADWYPDTLANWDLVNYGVPEDNFDETPSDSTYTYTKLQWDHFIISVNLSCHDEANPSCGNCSDGDIPVAADAPNTRWTEITFNPGGNFCQMQ